MKCFLMSVLKLLARIKHSNDIIAQLILPTKLAKQSYPILTLNQLYD